MLNLDSPWFVRTLRRKLWHQLRDVILTGQPDAFSAQGRIKLEVNLEN